MSALLPVHVLFAVLGLCVGKILLFSRKTLAPLPPGPKRKLLLGNLYDLPRVGEQEWVHWSKHRDLYGPISSVSTFGQTLVILNDQHIAFELLDKRSTIYSSRPKMVFGGEMVGWENTLAGQNYSDRFRAYRKHIHAFIGTKLAISQFNVLLDVEARRFLLRALDKPDMLTQNIRTWAGAIILKISHGYTIEPHDQDPLVDLADEVLTHFSLSAVAGVWLVDTLPFIKYLPEWIPGMGFKRTAAEWRKALIAFVEKPHAFVKKQMSEGVHEPSFTSALLEEGNLSPEQEFIVKWSAQAIYAGGADTTVAAMQCFFLAMIAYPEVQRKAQEEIDRIIGNDRLPTVKDRENLPYVEALVKEVLRWHPVGPLAFPHTSTEDDIYEGYFIPKGALLIPNIWLFTHDPQTYHDPMEFKPERFLDDHDCPPEMDPRSLSFGFGRRSCPGRELADASLYLAVAQSLAVFNINKAVKDGKVIEPLVAFTPGAISHPVDFKASIKPRNTTAEELIRSVEDEYPFTTSDANTLLSMGA